MSLSDKIEVFNFTSRNLDGFLNSDNHYFEQMISPIDLDIVKLTFLDGDVLAALLLTSHFLCLSQCVNLIRLFLCDDALHKLGSLPASLPFYFVF